MDELLKIRIELDEAITYSHVELARRLAHQGLELAQYEELPGEIEYFKGQFEILDENYSEAIAHFKRAIKYNPKDGASFNDIALCLVELGKIDEAFKYFDQGIEAEPDYANVYHNKGWLLNKIGKCKEAISYFEKTLELEPERPVTYENLAYALGNLGDYESSLSAYRKALELLKPEYKDIKESLLEEIKKTEQLIQRKKSDKLKA
jgi:tetratricopeptide (TPR) repeat protein